MKAIFRTEERLKVRRFFLVCLQNTGSQQHLTGGSEDLLPFA